MRVAITILAAAVLPAPLVLVAAPKTAPILRKLSAAEVARAQKLIAQLGDNAYAKRLAAHKALEKMGPSVVPVLRRHRNTPDPEIAARIVSLLSKLDWAGRGALVVRIKRKTQAARLGMLRGDVIVRVNGDDITSAAGLVAYDHSNARQCIVWRRDELKTFRLEPGQIGVYIEDWHIDAGGRAHALGLSEAVAGNFRRAYTHLKTCREAWNDDAWTLQIMVGLAEWNLDHELALDVYGQLQTFDHTRMLRKGQTWLTDGLGRGKLGELPLGSVHVGQLLAKAKGPFDPAVHGQLAWAVQNAGRNAPYSRQLVAEDWADRLTGPAAAGQRHAALRLACHDRDYKRAMRLYSGHIGQSQLGRSAASEAVIAAIGLGDVQAATAASMRLIDGFRDHGMYNSEVSNCMGAMAAVVAAGRVDLLGRYTTSLGRLTPHGRGILLGGYDRVLFQHPHVSEKMSAYLAGAAAEREAIDKTRAAYLDTLFYAPSTTLATWRQVYGRQGQFRTQWQYEHWRHAEMLLRHGQYDEARGVLKKHFPEHWSMGGITRSLDFFEKHHDRLGKDWADLRGTVQLFDAAERGARWAVRWDGQTFYIDAGGKVSEPPGLLAGQPHDAAVGERIWVNSTGTIHARRSAIYLLEEKPRRWVRTFASPAGYVPLRAEMRVPAGPVALRHAMTHFPATGPGRELMYATVAPGKWSVYHFNGDIALAVQAKSHKVVDLGRAIAGRLGRKRRVPVYRAHYREPMLLVPTAAGLWTLGADGTLTDLVLDPAALKPDKTVAVLDWWAPPGKACIGVAPQQGGKVYHLNLTTGRLTLTKGYCGLGPEDSFAWFMTDRWYKRLLVGDALIQSIHDVPPAGREAAK